MSETPQEFVTRWLNQVPTPVQEHVREAIQAVLAEIERLRLHMDGCGRTTANLAKSAEAAEAERDALRIDLQTADDRNRALRAEVERLRAGIEDNAARWSEMARALTAKAERAEAALAEWRKHDSAPDCVACAVLDAATCGTLAGEGKP